MSKKAGNLLATVYLIIILGIYPFYMKNGYVEIGKAKFEFWVCTSIACALLMLFFFVMRIIREKTVYTMDVWVLSFGMCNLLSYLVSVNRKEAFWGTDGWNMGVLLYGLLCLLYFMITRLWKPEEVIVWLSLAVAGGVFLLGLLDRFSIYVIPLEIRDPGFISTLGNINWFCGYLVIFLSVGAGMFVFGRKGEGVLALFCLLGCMVGFAQGGSSVFLFFGGLLIGLFWIAAEQREWMLKWFVLVGIWCLSAQAVRLMRFFLDGYNYDTKTWCGYFTDSNMTLYLLAAGAFLFLVFLRISSDGSVPTKRIRLFLVVSVMVCAVGYMGLGCYRTYLHRDALDGGHLLVWDDAWGNGRGITIRTGISLLKKMPLQNKLFGVGADCFASYAYAIPEISAQLAEHFDGSRLTNAHNEWITMMVNFGFFGTISYYGIFVSYFSTMKQCGKNPFVLSVGIATFCYLLHNMVSFANVLNLPFLFVLLAMGQKCCIIMNYDRVNGDTV